LTIITCLYSW